MHKWVNPCTTLIYSDSYRTERAYPVFCEIKIAPKKEGYELSISGVEGPFSSGNAAGGCGQIDMHISEIGIDAYVHEYAPGWDRARFQWFIDIWNKWHLNGMRAGCEHQRAWGWGKKKLMVAELSLTNEAWQARAWLERMAQNNIRNGRLDMTGLFTEEEVNLYALPTNLTVPGEEIEEYMRRHGLAQNYRIKELGEKLSTWVYEKDHPDGVLSKPCPVCGYKFGSAWLFEPLPQGVVDFLDELPDVEMEVPVKWRQL